jgi:glycosyltransferase involved in cell wall biosynthesis
MDKISIVTVAWNNAEGLEKTIQSVVNQTYKNTEFIIIDGGSTDGTIDIINRYKEDIDYWVCEKDDGIYDAMNKGIKVSTGDWLSFMNSGDVFYNKQVLDDLTIGIFPDKSIIYGNNFSTPYSIKPFSLKKLECGIIMASHQAMLFNKKIISNQLYYNCKYKIYADYDLVNRIYLLGLKFQYINNCVSIREPNGISSIISWTKRWDKLRIVFKSYGMKGIFNAYLGKNRYVK